MKKSTLIKIISGVAGLAVVSGIYLVTSNTKPKANILGTNTNNENQAEENKPESKERTSTDEDSSTAGILKSLINGLDSRIVHCTYVVKNGELGLQSAEIFIKNNGAFRVYQGDGESHMLALNEKLYLWGNYGTGLPNQNGMVLDYKPFTDENSEPSNFNSIISPEGLLALVENSDYSDEISNLSCSYSTNSNDESLFIVPNNIEFLSMEDMVKMSM